jgi:hypothetical protein
MTEISRGFIQSLRANVRITGPALTLATAICCHVRNHSLSLRPSELLAFIEMFNRDNWRLFLLIILTIQHHCVVSKRREPNTQWRSVTSQKNVHLSPTTYQFHGRVRVCFVCLHSSLFAVIRFGGKLLHKTSFIFMFRLSFASFVFILAACFRYNSAQLTQFVTSCVQNHVSVTFCVIPPQCSEHTVLPHHLRMCSSFLTGRNGPVGLVTRLRTGPSRDQGLIPCRDKRFYAYPKRPDRMLSLFNEYRMYFPWSKTVGA